MQNAYSNSFGCDKACMWLLSCPTGREDEMKLIGGNHEFWVKLFGCINLGHMGFIGPLYCGYQEPLPFEMSFGSSGWPSGPPPIIAIAICMGYWTSIIFTLCELY